MPALTFPDLPRQISLEVRFELWARATRVFESAAQAVVMAAAGEGIHVVESPDDRNSPRNDLEERAIVEQSRHPVKIYDIGRIDLRREVTAMLTEIGRKQFVTAGCHKPSRVLSEDPALTPRVSRCRQSIGGTNERMLGSRIVRLATSISESTLIVIRPRWRLRGPSGTSARIEDADVNDFHGSGRLASMNKESGFETVPSASVSSCWPGQSSM